jgi:hypothetical protein
MLSQHVAGAPALRQTTYGELPLGFEKNQGQTDPEVRFLTRGNGYSLFLTSNEAVLAVRGASGKDNVLRMKLAASNPASKIEGVEELPGKINYLVDGASHGQTGISSYARVRYRDVYPGIDLVYYGRQRQLEYDLIVAPHASASGVRLSFSGAQAMRIDEHGDLVFQYAEGEIRQHKPSAYQEIDGVKKPVAASYILRGAQEVGLLLAKYDHNRQLIIDPVYGYSTMLGGNGEDSNLSVAVDGAGNAYLVGNTISTTYPGTAGAFQTTKTTSGTSAFVAKLNSSGSALVYYTYIGGTKAAAANWIAIDPAGNA